MQTREKTLDALIDSGDATLLDRAVHQLQADMDEKLDARVHELSVEYAHKSMEAVSQEQERLLQALTQAGELSPEDTEVMLEQYDKEVQKIEAKFQQV